MTEPGTAAVLPAPTLRRWLGGLSLAAIAWVAAYAHLADFADALVAALGLTRGTHLAEAVHFFFYDTPKVLLLLTGIVFVMGIIQTFFSPERTRALLSGRRLGVGNVLAAIAGHRHAVLLLLGGAAVHRLSFRRGADGRDLFVPDFRADGQ